VTINRLAQYIAAVINRTSRISGIIAIVFLLAMMAITVSDVFLRYVFNSPIIGSVEITESLMVVGGFLGIAWCAVKRAHVKVDLIQRHLPHRIRAIFESITYFLGLLIVPFVAWQGFAQAVYMHAEDKVSTLLKIPAYPFYGVIGIGYALLFFVLLTLLAGSVIKVIQR
jgi:TRAP-type C4-dicarboxylate transport system permease small subunit